MTAFYIPRLRPAGYATLPEGLAWRFVEAPHEGVDRPDLPWSRHPFGVIAVDRPLTVREVLTFGLAPAALLDDRRQELERIDRANRTAEANRYRADADPDPDPRPIEPTEEPNGYEPRLHGMPRRGGPARVAYGSTSAGRTY